MAERNSEYVRVDRDTYVTPPWVYAAIRAVEAFDDPWDCAPVDADFDFLQTGPTGRDILTNPPYKLATLFALHALQVTRDSKRKVGLLLPMAFDAARGRRGLWHPPFKAKYTLTRRIRWTNLEQKQAGPSMNHAWFIWDWQYEGKPFMGWL